MKILAVILVLHLVFSCSNKSKENHFSTANLDVKEKKDRKRMCLKLQRRPKKL